MSQRVVVTGLGAVTPIGNTVDDFWKNLRDGVSGAARISNFDPTGYKTQVACEVKDFDPTLYMEKKEARRLDPFTRFAVGAAHAAYRSAQLREGLYDPDRSAVILGVGIGGFLTMEQSVYALIEKGPTRLDPFTIPKLITNSAPAKIAILYQIYGPVYSLATACASGTDAIAHATQQIRSGVLDMVITGGVEAGIVASGVAGFNALQALSTNFNDDPQRASRPFDADRDGFVIGEGAAILILESEAHAQKRGAPILGEVAGSASTCDAFHATAPHATGRGIVAAMSNALADAHISTDKIDYINAHGTSTKLNDKIETDAIKEVFGDHARTVKISSTKSMHGHMIGATGAIEAIACLLAIRDGYIPPTINYDTPDPDCDLNYTPNSGVSHPVEYAMSNSLGFGGHNGVVILRRYHTHA